MNLQLSGSSINDELYETSSDCIKIISLEGNVKRVNPGGKIAMELDHLEQLNGSAWPSLWPDSERERIERAMATGFEGKGTQFMAFCPTAKQTPRWWDVVVTPILVGPGTVGGLLAVSRDVTELVEAREALALADKRKNEFLAVLSHELRNPLSTLGMAAKLLDSGGVDPLLRARVSEVMKRQVGHMSRLAEDLLDVSRITRGEVHLRIADCDLREVVGEAAEQLAAALASKQQDIHQVLPDVPVRVSADQARLVQVVGNLIGNASRYSPPSSTIGITLSVDDGKAVLAIVDQGQGISAELMPALFDAYSQGQASPDSKTSGVGLGLAIVKGLVELHGGEIRVASPGPGMGSTFTVVLPLKNLGLPENG